jgi:hypothetical protein
MLGSFVVVGSKRISENSVARRFSTGTLSTMKSHSNAPAKSNGLSRTGMFLMCFTWAGASKIYRV